MTSRFTVGQYVVSQRVSQWSHSQQEGSAIRTWSRCETSILLMGETLCLAGTGPCAVNSRRSQEPRQRVR